MNILDIVILVLVAIAAVHGLKLGAAVQVTSFAGFVAGIVIGVVLVLWLDPHVGGQVAKSIVALILLFVPAGVLGGTGRQIGMHLWRTIRASRLSAIDSAAGAAVAVAGTLVLCWVFSSVLVNSRFTSISQQVQSSTIVRALDEVMPPVPDEFQTVEKFLSNEGFPVVFANLAPQPAGPVTLPGTAQVRSAVAAASPSTVRVIGIACGEQQEGSGFVVAPHFVVTNAHVVAGVSQITVEIPHDSSFQARAVDFDPRFDLAVLEVQGPALPPPLRLDPSLIVRGTKTAVLGYPEDGPFDAEPAAVRDVLEAVGLDIYGNQESSRTVYEIDSLVRPGNSGGPLVLPDGEVVGVVFSRSSSDPSIGYALASPGVLSRVQAAESDPRAVGTGPCIG